MVNKRVLNVLLCNKSASVVTEDEEIYSGDLIVGADGVHSRIRSEMLRLAEEIHPRIITTQEQNSKCSLFDSPKRSRFSRVKFTFYSRSHY